MTREEAIKNIKEHCYFANLIPQAKESLDMAIQTLEQEPNIDMNSEEIKILQKRSYLEGFHESLKISVKQEPCEDCVSRQAVLDLVSDYDLSMGQVVKGIHSLPSVTPKQKIGRWIDFESLDGALWYACSECGETDFYRPNYCPDCGAKMEREE